MIRYRFAPSCLVAVGLSLCATWGLTQVHAYQPPPPPDAAEGVEILTRGPVHAAFAETIVFDPEPGFIAPKMPPQNIEEIPPTLRPEGDNVVWIDGYWAWDDERDDFVWISGIWRALPPGRQWFAGYWSPHRDGAQFTNGYWADANVTEVEYLPEPPASVEIGPNRDAPSADHRWLPGVWIWQQNRYMWRTGYWAAGQSDWDWVPAHYVWTPRGYVYVNGYYDHSVARRGVLFAPVYFNSGVYAQRGFSYSPASVINTAVFASHLFLRPNYGHYYYGDYYGRNYASAGFSPWFTFHSSHSGYDPFYAHQHWQHRNDRQWDSRMQADYAHRRDHEEARPPRTWTDQRERGTREATNKEKSFVVTASLDDVTKNKDSVIKYQRVAQEERQKTAARGQDYRTAREERQKLEASAADPAGVDPVRNSQPIKVKLPKSPIASQPLEQFGVDKAPPRAIEAPLPDIKIEPKPRQPRVRVESPPGDPKGPKLDPRPNLPKVNPNIEPRLPKVDPQPLPRVNLKPVPGVDPMPVPKVEPQPDRPKLEPKPPRVESKDPPKVEPRPVPKVDPQPIPRTSLKPMPNVDPKPAPRAEPQPDRPKLEPKEPPKVERKDPPKIERKDPPQRRPMDAPKGGSGDRPKGGSKGPPKSEGKKP